MAVLEMPALLIIHLNGTMTNSFHDQFLELKIFLHVVTVHFVMKEEEHAKVCIALNLPLLFDMSFQMAKIISNLTEWHYIGKNSITIT